MTLIVFLTVLLQAFFEITLKAALPLPGFFALSLILTVLVLPPRLPGAPWGDGRLPGNGDPAGFTSCFDARVDRPGLSRMSKSGLRRGNFCPAGSTAVFRHCVFKSNQGAG